jgi:hypothetical protein
LSAARFAFCFACSAFSLTGGAAPPRVTKSKYRLSAARYFCFAGLLSQALGCSTLRGVWQRDIKKPGGLMCLPGLGIVYEGYFTCFW